MKRIAFLLCLLAFPAHAQMCGKYADAEKYLKEKYGEQVAMVGNMSNETTSATAQFWMNRQTKTWTVLVVDDKGNACVVAAGDDLRAGGNPTKPDVKS